MYRYNIKTIQLSAQQQVWLPSFYYEILPTHVNKWPF